MNRSDDLFPQPGGTPDPYWHRAFDEAIDTPPPRVWEGVERQLDLDESDGILPLWQHRQGRQSMLFGRWAAGIAASLMLTALGWWAWHREDAIRPDASIAVTNRPHESTSPGTLRSANPLAVSAEAEATKVYTLPTPRLADALPVVRPQVRSGASPGTSTRAELAGTLAMAETPAGMLDETTQPENRMVDPATGQPQALNGTLFFTETKRVATQGLNDALPFQSGLSGFQPATIARPMMMRSITSQSFNTYSVGGQLTESQSFSEWSITFQSQSGQLPPVLFKATTPGTVPGLDRSALVADAPTQESLVRATPPTNPLVVGQKNSDLIAKTDVAKPASVASEKRRRRWVSAGVAASAFSPAVAIRSTFSPVASMALSSFAAVANVAPRATADLQSQVGRAVAFQAGIGIPLGERWSVETGVGYLSGQNDIQSPARISSLASSNRSATTDNLYADLLTRAGNQSATANMAADKLYNPNLANPAADYTSAQQQVVSNVYEFVQVPVQVGYELRPRRKFGLALLTGLVSNWFVRNTVAETITVKPGDGVYRPVTLAGTAGMRLRYRPDTNWSASVAGTFQHNLQSLTLSDVSLQANPQQVGLSFSVDRHF